MAQGITQQLIFNTNKSFMQLCLNIEETYDVNSNTSDLIISSIQAKTTSTRDSYYPNGYISVNGTQLEPTMSSYYGTHKLAVYNNSFSNESAIINDSTETVQAYRVTGIKHNDDGTKSITIGVSLNFVPVSTSNRWSLDETVTVSLTNIPRTSNIASAESVTLRDACKISWIPNATSFRYKIRLSLNEWSYTTGVIHPNQTSTYTYSDYMLPIDVANQITTSTYGTMTATLYTYSDSNCSVLVGSSAKTFTVYIPTDIVPTLGSVSSTINNPNSVVANWGIAVAGYTNVIVSASAQGSYGSTITSFTISGGYNVTYAGSSLSYSGGVITSSGEKTFTVYATDSRGRTTATSTTAPITFYAYSNPNIVSFVISRDQSDKSQVIAKAVWSHSSVNGNNVSYGSLYYREANSSVWNDPISINNNVETNLGVSFEETLSYNFLIEVRDSLSATKQDGFISTINVLLDFRAGGRGLGIGKIAESDNLEIALNTIFVGDVYIRNQSGDDISLDDYIKNLINVS